MKNFFLENIEIIKFIILILFIINGYYFRQNWESQHQKYKYKCWIIGLIVIVCFLLLLFIDIINNNIYK